MVTEVLDLIKQLYAKGNPEVKEIILQHFIKEEVEKPSYKDIKTVKDVYDYIFKNTSNTFNLKDDYIGVAKFIEISAINAVLNELSPTSDNNEDYYTAYEIQFYGTGYDPDPKEIDVMKDGNMYMTIYLLRLQKIIIHSLELLMDLYSIIKMQHNIFLLTLNHQYVNGCK